MKPRLYFATLAFTLATAGTSIYAQGAHDAHGSGHEHTDMHVLPAAIGEPGKRVTRTVKVDMTDDMRFRPASITVKKGETVRFVVKNSGKMKHEMVLGTPQMLKEHYDMMMKMPGMEHEEPNMVTVAPGATGEIVWRFTQAGNVDFACLQPGHLDAGMKGAVRVR